MSCTEDFAYQDGNTSSKQHQDQNCHLCCLKKIQEKKFKDKNAKQKSQMLKSADIELCCSLIFNRDKYGKRKGEVQRLMTLSFFKRTILHEISGDWQE